MKQKNKQFNKCLVTGGSGFIGKHLIKALTDQGHEVISIHHTWLTTDPRQLERLPSDLDWIFHLAAFGNMAHQKDPSEILNANVFGIYNLLRATEEIPYKAFVNISSSSVLLPYQTMYAATKRAAEDLCQAFVSEFNKPIVTIRPYSVYGPNEAEFRFIPTVFRSILNRESMRLSPNPIHDWIYVDDLVNEIIKSARNIKKLSGQVLNVGTGIGTKNVDIVRKIEKITHKKLKAEIVDNLRSFDTLDWVCPDPHPHYMGIDEGLKRYYESIAK